MTEDLKLIQFKFNFVIRKYFKWLLKHFPCCLENYVRFIYIKISLSKKVLTHISEALKCIGIWNTENRQTLKAVG